MKQLSCNICGTFEDYENRIITTYKYNIKCDCHKGNHIEICSTCKDCVPKPPKVIKCDLKEYKDIDRKIYL